jgi:hypothetical protein
MAIRFPLNITDPLRSKEIRETAEAIRNTTDLRKTITIKV